MSISDSEDRNSQGSHKTTITRKRENQILTKEVLTVVSDDNLWGRG